MPVINEQTALQEFTEWMDAKKVKAKTREQLQPNIEMLVDCICDGILSIDPSTNAITHKLDFPVLDKKGEPYMTSLTYKARLTGEEQTQANKSLRPSDPLEMRLLATASALTGKLIAELNKMDTADMKITQAISLFFM